MRQDDKKIAKVFYIIGIVPIIWTALLVAPYINGGIIEIFKNSSNIFTRPFNISFTENSIKTVLIFLLIYILAILVYESTRKNYRRREENGSAKWGDAKELNKKYKQPNNYNKILTKNVSIGLNGKKHRRNVNVLVIGGSGAGKTFKRKCSNCKGTGKVRKNKNLTINIPAGINTGDRLRVSGKGNPGSNGGENGDLYLEFVVDEHDVYIRQDDDIYVEVPLSLTDALLGCKKEIPTLYGNVKINIAPGTNSGDKQRLRGKGVDNKYHNNKGDMYVVFKVYTPKKLTREQKSLIDKLSNTEMDTPEIKEFNRFVRDND